MLRRFLPRILLLCTFGCAAAGAEQKPEELPRIDRAARAKILRADAARCAELLEPLNQVLKPVDAQAAELKVLMKTWSDRAAALQNEAASLERSSQPIADPAPKIQGAAAGLRGAASRTRDLRQGVVAAFGSKPAAADDVLRAAGFDLAALAGVLDGSAQQVTGASAEKLQAEIERVESGVLTPLRTARQRVQQAHATYEKGYRRLDPDVARKNDEIGYWLGEREKHQANMEEAERRCAASAKVVLGISVCTDLQSKAWFMQAQLGVNQADAAIALAQAAIGALELQRAGDAVGMGFATATMQLIDARIAEVDQQVQTLRDARATLLALTANRANQALAQEKRSLASSAAKNAAAFKTQIDSLYQPFAAQVKQRSELTARRNSLLRQAQALERPPPNPRGRRLG